MVNRVQLIGRWGKDPELVTSKSGLQICNLSLATNHKIKGEEQTSWHTIVAFGKTAEAMGKYCKKGKLAFVEGELRYDHYTDKDGKNREKAKIFVDRFKSLEWSDTDVEEQSHERDVGF